jgi:hypothetical protein
VGYRIRFVRPEPGRSLDETLQDVDAKLDSRAKSKPLRLTPQQRAAWDRVVQRVTGELGPASCEEFPSDLVLRRDGPSGHLDLEYRGDSASMDVDYLQSGRLASPAILTEAYSIAAIVEQETGLAGYDLQAYRLVADTDLALATQKFDEAIAALRQVFDRRAR